MLEPGETEVQLAGKPMLTPCAKDVVVKAASNATIVNFMVLVAIGESSALRACRLFIKKCLDKNNILSRRSCHADVDYRSLALHRVLCTWV